MNIILTFIKKTVKWIVVAFFASTILSVVALRWVPVWFTPLMFIRLAQQSADDQPLTLHHHWVPLDEISPSLPVAVIASEDSRFMEHNGFDYKAIEQAATNPGNVPAMEQSSATETPAEAPAEAPAQ